RIVARTLRSYPLSLPGPNLAEQLPEDWWSALAAAVRSLADQTGDLAGRTAALVFCAQMCGVVATGADGSALRPALIWLDKRSAPITRRLVGGFPSLNGYQLFRL